MKHFICIALFVAFFTVSTVFSTRAFDSITAMTTQETEYFIPPNMQVANGVLPPGIMISIHEIDQPEGFILISFQTASGNTIKGIVNKDSIEPSFYQTPEPREIIQNTPTPEPTSTPSPTPTPLPASAQTIRTSKRTPAYHLQNPRRIIGYFPQNVELIVLSNGPSATSYVLYKTDKGRTIHALCRKGDIGSENTTTAPTPKTFSGHNDDAGNAHWHEDYSGWKEALSLQRKTKQKLLLYFYSDWSSDSKVLEKELLMTSDFLRESPDFIKVKINPEHSKYEARLATKYDLATIPSVFIVDEPSTEPRRIRLLRKMYGNTKTLDLKKAMLELRAPPPEKKKK